MIDFILGLMTGGIFGFFITAMIVVGSDGK
jgi:hypothetical protein